MATLEGGAALLAKLKELSAKVAKPGALNVGFLETAIYPDGTPVAYIAAIQEFGATIQKQASETTIYRQVNDARTRFLKKGRFVKKDKSNFATTHDVKAHTITIPARPFFRTMIANGSKHWGSDLGKLLTANGYEVNTSLNQLGEEMVGELQVSIRDWTTPPNAPSTIAKKGFDKPLIDTGDMMRAVASEVNA